MFSNYQQHQCYQLPSPQTISVVSPQVKSMNSNNNQHYILQQGVQTTLYDGSYKCSTGIQENDNENTYQSYPSSTSYSSTSSSYENQQNHYQYDQSFVQQKQPEQQVSFFNNNQFNYPRYQQSNNNQIKQEYQLAEDMMSQCDESKSQINSCTSIQQASDCTSSYLSYNQMPTMVMSPSSSSNSPKNQSDISFKISSLSHIQENYYDNQNQISTLQLDQTNHANLTPSKSSSSPSHSTQTFSQAIESRYISKSNNSNIQGGSQEGENENRRIIQTYQRISKININKNIIKAFKKFMLDKDNSEIITSFGIVNESKNQCKLMKIFFDSLNHNNHSVTKIIDHPLYGGAFEFFLTFYAESWLKSSRVQDKQAHFVAIDFFKLCCTENKVKLSNFKYYSKRKTDNNNNNTKPLNPSSVPFMKDSSCQSPKNSGCEMSFNESDQNMYSEENSNQDV